MDDTPAQHAGPAEVSLRALDGRIWALAWPAFGALIAEPLFVMIDSAVVGHLGTSPLAGLTLASTLLATVVAVFIFLAYGTTAAVARKQGAGDMRGALEVGVDGIWLAIGIGVVITAVGVLGAPQLVGLMGASPEVAPHAVQYLRYATPGITGMLVVLASTGALRGLQDTRTPFVVAVAGAIVNAVGSVILVYGAHLGIAGSGLATAVTQLAMGAVLVWRVLAGAQSHGGVRLRPRPAGIGAGALSGLPLFVRTLTLRLAILLTVFVATSLGDVPLAAHQVVNSMWGLAVFALDALAIAAQALIGQGLGAGEAGSVRAITRRTTFWGVVAGAGVGVVIAGLGWVLTPLFTPDAEVRSAAVLALLVCGLLMPVAGYVFVLDGVLIGAGDGRYLAWAGVITLLAYTPLLAAVWAWAPHDGGGLAWLWLAFGGGLMLARAIANGVRARGSRWMVLGA